jgi:hypothetical protein
LTVSLGDSTDHSEHRSIDSTDLALQETVEIARTLMALKIADATCSILDLAGTTASASLRQWPT